MKFGIITPVRATTALVICVALNLPQITLSAPTYQFVDLAPNNTPAQAFGAYTTPTSFQQVGYMTISSGGGSTSQEAAIFNGPGGPITDLGSGAAWSGYAMPTGTQQVGVNASNQAMLWSGSASSAINLQPTGWYSSSGRAGYYTATTGAQQFGNAVQTGGGNNQALLWSGSASNFVNLTPNAWAISTGYGAYVSSSGAHQVGTVSQPGALEQAAYWSGSAGSFVDLNPNGALRSFALSGSATPSGGEMIVGDAAFTAIHDHPIVWLSANPNDYIDLFPLVGEGTAWATNGRYVVGTARGAVSVFVWDSQTNQVTNLYDSTPAGYVTLNTWAMDVAGDVIGTTEVIPPGGQLPQPPEHASEWLLIPEPTSIGILCLTLVVALRRDRMRI